MSAFARARVGLFYWWRHGRWPMLKARRRFTEWVQWRKLYDRDAGLAALTDKLHSKEVAERLAPGIAVPTLWLGLALPEVPPAPLPLVVKSNHGCNQYRIVRTDDDWRRARSASARWVGRRYGGILDEWHYRAARPMLLVELFLGGAGAPLPLDYKVYVFGGRAAVVQVHVGRGGRHRWTQYDRDWTPLSRCVVDAARPVTLARMLAMAERLAGERDFLRVDFYEVDGRLWFGEYCLFPGSGLDPFDPFTLDDRLGALWSAAAGLPWPAASEVPLPLPAPQP